MGLPVFGAVSGAIKGAEDNVATSTNRVEVQDPGAFERRLRSLQGDFFTQLQNLTDSSGVGAADVQASTSAQRDLASTLQQLSQTGGLPGSKDLAAGQNFAQQAFAPQQVALNQAFEQQNQQFARAAALSGRSTTDPVFRNQLAQQQTRDQELLAAQQNAAAQQFALALPGQRLQYQASRADVLGGLANQAFSNRQSLLQLGNTLANQERNYRLQTATRTNEQVQQGSLGQALLGGLRGFSAGVNIAGNVFKTVASAATGGLAGGLLGGGGGGGGGDPTANIDQRYSAPAFAASPAVSSYITSQGPGYFGNFQYGPEYKVPRSAVGTPPVTTGNIPIPYAQGQYGGYPAGSAAIRGAGYIGTVPFGRAGQ